MSRARTETRHIGGKRIRVERRTIAPRGRVAAERVAVAPPVPLGPTAIDCGHLLRHRPARFPTDFLASDEGWR